ncbi:helix-turn-helix domain-containing protein [Paenisporosarcina sp. TG-14]|uniref:helix-turn-helix domain-containing protein n=1 Tax=Paenisporosarcina sp. TG-14 TaxID=1231057 RepID=UPI0002E19341|nr:helix-turn-helix transcriptional regulator [Paenisporosarcina sp. TG-14]
MTEFARRLKQCREKKKSTNSMWTQQYVANKIGMARTTYTAYENGTKLPPLDTVNSIAILLDVTTDYLTGRTDTSIEHTSKKEEAEFEKWKNDPKLDLFFQEFDQADDEKQAALLAVWEVLKKDKN